MFVQNYKQQNLTDFLKENYTDIFDSINDEGYVIEYDSFLSFKEIRFENKVVGFITFDSFHIVPSDLLINECYIIPQYRGNDLLYNELFSLIFSPNANFYLRNPNRALINVLLKNGLALKFSDNLLISYIKFVVMIDTVYKNPKIKQFYKKTDDEVPYRADVYDMDLCSVLFLDPMLEYVKYSDVFALTLPRKNDLKKYKLRKKLKRVNESYLDKCYDAQQENQDEILEFFDEVEEFVQETLSVENVCGNSENLKQDFTDYLNENDLTEKDGFRIIDHLNNALEEGSLTAKSYRRRIRYLVENIDAIDNIADEDCDDCPFCGKSNSNFVETCEFCGQVIRSESYENELFNQIENFDLDAMLDDLNDRIFSDDSFGNVPIEENDPLFELKTFYNEFLTGSDFDEIREYYLAFNGDAPICEIIENYYDFKIANENEEEGKFNLYKEYLCTFYYYHLDNRHFDEALSYIIQLAILASNDEDVSSGNIIERKSHSFDVFFEIDQFLNNEPVYNLDNAYKLAVENFKVGKWLNNKNEVFEIISQLLN